MSCSEVVNDRIIVFKDKGNNKCQIVFKNPNQHNVTKTRVDACLINDGGRCDFKLDCPTYENYIEIKGKDIIYACLQIEQTIQKISSDIQRKPKKSFVIATGAPCINGKIQIIIKRFKMHYNSSLLVRTRKHEEII